MDPVDQLLCEDLEGVFRKAGMAGGMSEDTIRNEIAAVRSVLEGMRQQLSADIRSVYDKVDSVSDKVDSVLAEMRQDPSQDTHHQGESLTRL